MKNPRNKAVAPQKPGVSLARARQRPLATVLHIDDDPNDTELFQAAARRARVRFNIQNVTDGEQAMAYLNGRGPYANRDLYPLPSLVLLDLKMPRATGFDVLRWIRNHPEVGSLNVIILSGSELRDDIQQAYAVGADSYLVKPIGFAALVELVRTIDTAWVGRPPIRPALLAAAKGNRDWPATGEWCKGGPGFTTDSQI